MKIRFQTFLIAACGAALFQLLGLPLPMLFGPMVACLLAAFAGLQLRGFGQVSVAARTIIGVAVGASITPALLLSLPQIALSVAIVPLYIALIGLIGVPYFRRVCGYDPATAYFAAMPGGLQDMVIFGQEAGGSARVLSLVHATRVLIIVTLAPALLLQLYDVSLDNPIGEATADLPAHELLLMVLAALAGWKLGARVGLFGAPILGPMIVAALLSLTDLIHHRPPYEAINIAQFLIGTGIGVSYMGVTGREFRNVILAAVGFVVILAGLAAILAYELPKLTGLGETEAFLAFAPGGQAEMTVLAIVAGVDPGVVIAHHVLRVVLVILLAPVGFRLMGVSGAKG